MERPYAIFYKILNFMFEDFNWILLVIGVVYKCVVSYLASADLGRVVAKSPKYNQKPLPKIKNFIVFAPFFRKRNEYTPT